MNVCVPYWELPRIPVSWVPLLDQCHAVLASSRFIEHAFSCCSGNRVLYYPQTVFVDDSIKSDRARFGLPENAFCFVTCADVGSDLIRKNPVGTIDAFNRAFRDYSRVSYRRK